MTTALKIAVYNMRMLTDGDLKAADAICAGIDALTRERDEARARAVAAGEDADKRFPADEYYTNLNDALAQRDAALARAEKAEKEVEQWTAAHAALVAENDCMEAFATKSATEAARLLSALVAIRNACDTYGALNDLSLRSPLFDAFKVMDAALADDAAARAALAPAAEAPTKMEGA